jgi:hypothetical protein
VVTQLLKIKICAVSFILSISILVSGNSATALTQEQLEREAMMDKITSHSNGIDFLEKITFFGDMRLRWGVKNRDKSNSSSPSKINQDTERVRLRFRTGAKFHIDKELDMVFRISTGGVGSFNSGNQTLGSGLDKKDISLDQAYVSWSPNAWTIEGGKVKNRFMYSKMIFDSDLTFEGLTEVYKTSLGGNTLQLIGGQYFIEQNSRTTTTDSSNIMLWALQAQLHSTTKIGKTKLALGFYAYDGLRGSPLDNDNGYDTGQRNSMNSGYLLTDMKILDLMMELGTPFGSLYGKLFYEYAINTAENADVTAANTIDSDLDDAYQVGFRYGFKNVKKSGEWQGKFIYRKIEQNAVLSAFNDSTFHEGGTNAKGIQAGLKYQIRNGVQASYTFWDTENERNAVGNLPYDVQMHHLDLKFNF